jgi:DNA invertase Pin-like site-specific DNA recombinase
MKEEQPRILRCAIYTRKSTEEGLQQEFNTLQAQREAGEAYVLSQRASGWTVLPDRYDDGGFSGASLERPALQELLHQIELGSIDCVVVYKVDRLSRSLLDFARLMSLFERHGVSFVSVTQEFNSTSSIGRLTLNMLLSFAQFERELIGERTRDKLGAARRKGKWIGGIPVLGYEVAPKGGGLVVNAEEAERVREIFAIALKAGTLAGALQQVNARGLSTKQWTSESGRSHSGRAFDATRLGALLGNVQYKGMISHKGTLYPGEQEALISSELWEEVNRKQGRKESRQSQRGREPQRQDALLLNLLCCGPCGAAMLPTFTTKHGQRYRYYVCERAKRRECQQRPVAAEELEVSLRRHMEAILGEACNTIAIQQSIESVSFGGEAREVCIALGDGTRSTYSLPAVAGRGAREDAAAEGGRVPRISRIMALAIKLEQMVRERQAPNYARLAEVGHLSRARLSQILTLRNLAPSIQETLLLLPRRMSGRECVTEKQLRAIARQVDWDCQKKLFGSLMSRSSG